MKRLPLEPFEIATLAALALALAVLAMFGLSMDRASVSYTANVAFRIFPFAFAVGVILQVAHRFATRRGLDTYLRGLATLPWLSLWLRLWVACMVSSYVYFWVKVYVPVLNGELWDGAFWEIDRWVHLGLSPSTWLTELLEGTSLPRWLDRWYAIWAISLVSGIAFFTASRDAALRRSFVLSCVLLWTAGSWLYVSLPVHGPVFDLPELWSGLQGAMPYSQAGQRSLWENYQLVLADPTPTTRVFRHTLGMAAFPSLHVGFHWLFALWARVAAPALFWPIVAGTLLTQLGSVITGWHYAVDGYAGALLAWACFALARRIDPPPAGGEDEAPAELAGEPPA